MEELLTVREVVRMTGVSERTLYLYDKSGLLKAARTGDNVANNRKRYTWEDVDRLKAIVVLKEYGFQLKEIKAALDDPDFDIEAVLSEKVRELTRQANRLRNLVLFTKFVRLAGMDFFEAMAVGPEPINEAAEYLRDLPLYRKALRRIANYSPTELADAFRELDRIIDDMVHMDDSLGFAGIELAVGKIAQWWETYVCSLDEAGYLGFWAVFEDGSIVASEVEAVGGEAACANVQMFVFFVWLKDLMVQVEDDVARMAALVDTDVAEALGVFYEICGRVLVAMGYGCFLDDGDGQETSEGSDGADGEAFLSEPDFAGATCQFMSYMKGVLEDADLRDFIDPGEAIDLSPEDLEKVLEFVQLVYAEEGEGDEGEGSDGVAAEEEPKGGVPYVPRRRIGAECK
ncbi:MerR family transcriptional regulator [Parvibacter caecicola]|uniref:MerR family transcriptional regulator n=1 Tax=Parvibacter caecicola TaxID=747645 RepID=A0A4V5KJQ0_9ACTN|nr:MerR family transcriptional regulator [Parvibacter caecicola]TJW09876.1 MerR family transcriptional regulator [Parvibacter caecicola]